MLSSACRLRTRFVGHVFSSSFVDAVVVAAAAAQFGQRPFSFAGV
jgi:hypothetical protein